MCSASRNSIRALTLLLSALAFAGCTALLAPVYVGSIVVQSWGVHDLRAVSFTPLSDNLAGPDTRITCFDRKEEGQSWHRERDLFPVIAVERAGVTVTGSRILHQYSPEGFPFLVLARIAVKNETDRPIELMETSVTMDLRQRKDWRPQELFQLRRLPSGSPDPTAKSQSTAIPAGGELEYTMEFDYDSKSASHGRYRFDLRDAQTGEVFRYQFDAARARQNARRKTGS